MQTILIRKSPIRFNRRVVEVMMHRERKELWPVLLLLLLVRNGWYIGTGATGGFDFNGCLVAEIKSAHLV